MSKRTEAVVQVSLVHFEEVTVQTVYIHLSVLTTFRFSKNQRCCFVAPVRFRELITRCVVLCSLKIADTLAFHCSLSQSLCFEDKRVSPFRLLLALGIFTPSYNLKVKVKSQLGAFGQSHLLYFQKRMRNKVKSNLKCDWLINSDTRV